MLFKCSKKELKFETENVSEIVSNCCLIDRGPFPGKNLGKYSFKNAEGNWPISIDIGILQEYFCHTLVNCRYYH